MSEIIKHSNKINSIDKSITHSHTTSKDNNNNKELKQSKIEHKLSSLDSAKQIHYLLDKEKDDNLGKEKNNVSTSTFPLKSILRKLDYIVSEKEKHRNYKLISDFNREKTNLENEQAKIRQQIEDLAKMNINEKNINRIKEEKNKQQNLFNKYYKMNSETVQKINKFNEALPELESKIKTKQSKLKKINHENLELLEKIQEIKLRKIREYKTQIENNNINNSNYNNSVNNNNNANSNNIDVYENNANSITNNNTNNNNDTLNNNMNNSSILNKSKMQNPLNQSKQSKFKYSEYGKDNALNKSLLNITEIIDENVYLKDKFAELREKKTTLIKFRKENKLLSNEISSINAQIFFLSKVFSEGMHEIGVELRKVHEIQLDKIINKNSYGNSLYFELVKDIYPSNLSGNCYPLTKEIKLPIIHDNIQRKYNYPIIEKSEPKTFIYNVIKNMIDEHQLLNRNLNIRKKKFDWNEFCDFTAYQMFTILSLNKEIIKELERRIFPKAVSFYNVSKKNEFEKINEEDFVSDNEN